MVFCVPGVPRGIEYRELRRELLRLDGVAGVHGLHVWSLTLERSAVAVHLAVGSSVDHELVLQKATRLLQTKLKTTHCTVQVIDSNLPTVSSSRPSS